MEIKTIYEDNDLLVVDKPAGIIVFEEDPRAGREDFTERQSVISELIKQRPELAKVGEAPRYGIVHRLDKDTSGILLVAKTTKALIFLQKKFINREVEKKYTALVEGQVEEPEGTIKTLIARSKQDKRRQKAYTEGEKHPASAREAVTHYKVIEKYKNYTLTEVKIDTGRRHQIRCHLSYIGHPIAGDKMYGHKNSEGPLGLNRQFLHASYLKIQLPDNTIKEFISPLPEDLNKLPCQN